MPELIPFKNFHYKIGRSNPEKLRELTAPPYDVISEEEKLEFKKNSDNICHVILPEIYEAAGQKLKEMIINKTLVTEQDRCICIYGIDYTRPDTGEKLSRYGFVGLLKLEVIFPANDGIIPHEATFMKFTEDRLKLIQQTDSNFSPIFTIYNGMNGTAEKLFKKYIDKKPFLQTLDRDGFTHKIWEVWKEKDIEKFQKIVKNHEIIIADGHHRYITSLNHSRHGGCKYIMSLFIDFNDPGLIIYTSHRQIHKIFVKNIDEFREKVSEKFEIEDVEDIDVMKNKMENNRNEHVFGCYFQNKFLFLKLKDQIDPENFVPGNHSKQWKNLNLPILHHILFNTLGIEDEDITFVKGLKSGINNVDTIEEIKALFIVNPTKLEEVQEITRLGEILPQKSTFFWPKPLSGLIIHKHSNSIE